MVGGYLFTPPMRHVETFPSRPLHESSELCGSGSLYRACIRPFREGT